MIAFVNSLLMFYRSRHAPQNHVVPQTNSISVPPYWEQGPPAISPYMAKKYEQGPEFRRMWSVPSEGGDVLETPSRRRRLNGPMIDMKADL